MREEDHDEFTVDRLRALAPELTLEAIVQGVADGTVVKLMGLGGVGGIANSAFPAVLGIDVADDEVLLSPASSLIQFRNISIKRLD